jgi:redox-sensitive bicupin YhaK (pirin superfamily)
LHIEAPPESLVLSGGLFHGIQLWVNLPRANKWEHPRYQDIRGREETLLTTEDGGALVRVIAGDVAGYQGPGSTFTPITLVHATISPTAEMKLPWRSDFNALVYFLAGEGFAGEQLTPVRSGQLVVFGPGDYLQVGAARSQDSASPNVEVLVLGGLPIREPVVHYGPFVMNTKEEIAQAMQDYQAGRLGKIPAEAMPHRHASDVELPDA